MADQSIPDLRGLVSGGAPPAPAEDSAFLGIPSGFKVQRNASSTFGIGGSTGDIDRDYREQSESADVPVQDGDGNWAWSSGGRVYVKGDEWVPGQILGQREISELQARLYKAGLMPKGKFQVGRWDEVSRNAYKSLLEYANGLGIDDEEALGGLESAPMMDTTAQAPLQYRLPNEDDLRAVVKQSATSVLGRALDDATVSRISSAYINELRATQEANYAAAGVDGGVQQDMPDVTNFGLDQIKQANPEEARANTFMNNYNAFSQMISSAANSVQQF